MKQIILVFFSVILMAMMTACSSKQNVIQLTKQQILNIKSLSEQVNIQEDSCENPIDASHYPYVESNSKGNRGSIIITTAKHGDTVYDIKYNTIFTGLVKWKNHKCYSTAEKANSNPIVVNSNGHEIIVTLAYENNSESFTLNAGDNKLLSISHSNFPHEKAYVYVIVT